jgi:hypothetical protein
MSGDYRNADAGKPAGMRRQSANILARRCRLKPHPHHLRDTARIVAVRLVDLSLHYRLHVPRLDADHRQTRFGETALRVEPALVAGTPVQNY